MTPRLLCESKEAWEAWLREHHGSSNGVSLQLAKKGAGATTVTYAEALDVALCYGWIDARKLPLDGNFWLQRFVPRRPKSVWSRINAQKVEALIAQGKMQPAGLREVEAAKADGRWANAYASPKNASQPDDFVAELDKNPEAKSFFETLRGVNRYAIYYRIQSAKRPETRRARIAKFVAMLAAHQTLH